MDRLDHGEIALREVMEQVDLQGCEWFAHILLVGGRGRIEA